MAGSLGHRMSIHRAAADLRHEARASVDGRGGRDARSDRLGAVSCRDVVLAVPPGPGMLSLLTEPPQTAKRVYAPLRDTPVDPDVVLFAGRPGELMLLLEAALRAGVGSQVPFLGRPTCMALPAALAHGVIASTGCIGNRVYTDLGEDELYVAVPGKDLPGIAEETQAIAAANAELSEYHRGRRQALATE